MTRDEIITIIKPILEQHSVERASFFGSYARGTYIVGQLKNALAFAVFLPQSCVNSSLRVLDTPRRRFLVLQQKSSQAQVHF